MDCALYPFLAITKTVVGLGRNSPPPLRTVPRPTEMGNLSNPQLFIRYRRTLKVGRYRYIIEHIPQDTSLSNRCVTSKPYTQMPSLGQCLPRPVVLAHFLAEHNPTRFSTVYYIIKFFINYYLAQVISCGLWSYYKGADLGVFGRDVASRR